MGGEAEAETKCSQAIGGVFLMVVSAMGSSLLTQAVEFTDNSHGSFDFVIVASLLLSLIVQINMWQVLYVASMHAQDITNRLLPGLGYFLITFTFMGGPIFGIGNVSGAVLGLSAMMGLGLWAGYVTAGIIAMIVFLVRNTQSAVDNIIEVLNILKILIIPGVVIVIQPLVGMALKGTFAPSTGVPALLPSILTLMSDTVGGYITFASAHRLIDGGVVGRENRKRIVESACDGLGITVFSRFSLFMLVFGVVVKGVLPDLTSPAADVFLQGGEEICYRVFGLLLLFAGITSIIGASYTSLSFVKSLSKTVFNRNKAVTTAFTTCATLVMPLLSKPTTLLIVVNALNALVLPLALVINLVAVYRKDIVGEEYHYPIWFTVIGIVSAISFAYFAIARMGSLF